MKKSLVALSIAALLPSMASAQVAPQKFDEINAKVLAPTKTVAVHLELDQVPEKALVQGRVANLGADFGSARVDARSGRFVTLLPSVPMVPGTGIGNNLRWEDFGMLKAADKPAREAREAAALNAMNNYLAANQGALKIDVSELSPAQRIAEHGDGQVYQMHLPREFDGVPVRGSYIAATFNSGNLVLMTTHQWGDRGASSAAPRLSVAEAVDAVYDYIYPLQGSFSGGDLAFVTIPQGRGFAQGQGYTYQLVYSVMGSLKNDGGTWEALVAADTGEVIQFEDQNHYTEAKGGVQPETNDNVGPEGTEQAGWPMPFMEVGSEITTTGGNYTNTGTVTARFYGPYVNMADNCGTDSLTTSGQVDWGTSGGTDCDTPGFGGNGNTHSSRDGFYEINKIKEMARGQLPNNSWLQGRLTANMNINNSCNAFWNGSTINFYRSGGGCANTGEIAAVFDHEWGHGMDANDVNGGIASPSGEGIADLYTALRLNTSCIGRNFLSNVCSGNGDPCLTCTGVRDIDYLKRQSGNPHDFSWSNANCGSSVHCKGGVYSEGVWSLWKRKLTAAPYNYDSNRAHEVVTRLTFIAAGNTGTWFSGSPPNGGCGGGSGYLNYLAADDDNGNLNDGTPHMQAIYDAFNDQEIACNTPTVQDSGCSGTPTAAPSVNGTAGNYSASLSWGAVSGASSYGVYRTEGVFGCDFGKVKVAETTGTSFSDAGLQRGRDYSYVVIPMGSADSCFGPASSCTTVTPTGVAPPPPPPPPPPPTCAPVGASCSSNSDCCSNRCRGGRNNKTCK